MTSTRARHRASASPFHWASRSVVAIAAVPVGALAGCLAAAASSDQPALGLAGMTVAAVPLALHALHARRSERAERTTTGRHVWTGSVSAAGMDAVLAAMSVSQHDGFVDARIPAPRAAVDTAVVALDADALVLPDEVVDLRPEAAVPAPRAARDLEIAKLRRLWDAGTGPDTGMNPVVAEGQAA